MGVCWPKQARHTSQMDQLCMRGEELEVAAPARPSGRDGVMASPPPQRRRWLLEGAGAAFEHVLAASTVTYDQERHCPIRLGAWTNSQAIGGGPRGRERLRCKVIAYMKNRVRLLSINRPWSQRSDRSLIARDAPTSLWRCTLWTVYRTVMQTKGCA